MLIPISPPRVSSRRQALVAGTLLLASCGDNGVGTATDTATDGQGTSAGTTDPGPTSTGVTPTGAGMTGETGSSGDPTGAGTTESTGTGGSTDSGVSATTTAISTGDTTGITTGDTTGTTGDTTTGDIDDLPTSCLDVDFPVIAQLCGAAGPVCVVKRDELVSAKLAFRNDMPAIALRGDCGPAVLYSEAVGGYSGFYAERTGADAWTVEATPMSVATGSLDFDTVGNQAFAIVDDGAFGVTLWHRPGGLWKQASALAGQNHIRAPQLVRGPNGKIHIAHIDADQNAFHETYDGAWSKSQVDKAADIHVRLALDAAGKPSLTYWSSKEATWKLYYAAPPALPELVSPLQSNGLQLAHTSLALVGANATPWVWMAREKVDQLHHELVLLHRLGPGKWEEEIVLAEDAMAEKTCNGEPGGQGQQCDYDYVRLYPLALFSAKDEVRALYSAVNHKGTLISQCKDMPFPICVWVQQSDISTAALRIAWPGSKPPEHQVVASDVFTDRVTGRLDPGGNMHLAFYDQAPGAADPVVRYLAIGP